MLPGAEQSRERPYESVRGNESLASKPLEPAARASTAATDADDPERAVRPWEQAVYHYDALADHLTRTEEPVFDGGPTAVALELERAEEKLARARNAGE